MPWKAVDIMTLREEFTNLARQEGANISLLCERFGISRKTGYKLLGRVAVEGPGGLADRSRYNITLSACAQPNRVQVQAVLEEASLRHAPTHQHR